MFEAEMYHGMSRLQQASPQVHRGMALHKMIRLATLALGGEAYLAFEGNTFGHPEWLDFPREGNGWSYKHCRRQWNLVDDPSLRYCQLENWDRSMQQLQCSAPWLQEGVASFVSLTHEGDKIIVAERGTGEDATVFVFNFHPSQSFTEYSVPVPAAGGEWQCVLSSDDGDFGGMHRVHGGMTHHALGSPLHGRADHVKVYLPSRTVLVYRRRCSA
jgi:1,4-alpha-glucan branching enzyme